MADLKERFPPRRPASSKNSRDAACRTSARDQGLRSWIRVDASGESQVIEVDKLSMMRRCDLPARDLRLLDPSFVYPSTILGRDRAIVVNLEQIRCIITADEVFLFNSLDINVKQYVAELQRRLPTAGVGEVLQTENVVYLDHADSDSDSDRSRRLFSNIFDNSTDLPFEFKAFEVALEAVCTLLDSQTIELEMHIYPLLDELTSRISTSNLDRVRRSKRSLVALTRRVQKVRDEIEQLLDDDGDMAEMYLTEKKSRMESAAFFDDQSMPEKSFSIAKSRHESITSASESVVELEMLLEAYFVDIDSTLNKLKVLNNSSQNFLLLSSQTR
ncbi:hypothetical protein DCAR_0729415 [Daucus carota subsp. sativus]|uniref:Magnesium transporter n=1 Tax=Daucus carota subsp. sativus TaxID=79200 RepID=A0AAF0XND3_DAUCS|nr:hypothetical protein DCAR_0729415 [Daucus carota subsp. sativus]